MTDFTVTAVNESNNDFYFYMFQKSPELESAGFSSTAWLTTAYKIKRNGGVAKFKWSINYGLQWSQQSVVAPGVVVGQGARPTPVSTEVGANNYVKFGVIDNTPQFTDPLNKGSAGSLFIDTIGANPAIPPQTFVFGLSVNDKLAWATAAQNGLLLSMTPKVKFWLTSGAIIAQNEVLESNVTSNAAAFDFKDGLNNAVIKLNSDNTWSKPEYSATPMLKGDAETSLQSAPTAAGLISDNRKSSSADNEAYSKSDGIYFSEGKSESSASSNGLITGVITIQTAIGIGFAYIIASGIKLQITGSNDKGTSFKFSYSGRESQAALAAIFAAGKDLLFSSK
jgi:hypothetical protein